MTLHARPLALVALLLAAAPLPSLGNGAFPDSMALLLPADHPDRIILVTNFGLVFSEDAGATWRLSCEEAIGPGSFFFYQLGAPPDDALYAVGFKGIYWSRDNACGWTRSGGSIDDHHVPIDAFADPNDPLRILALSVGADGTGSTELFESLDGGRNFGPSRFTAPANTYINGVEIARSAPTLYLTMWSRGGNGLTPFLVRSTDGGASFKSIDVTPYLGQNAARILAVDPADARRIFLRVLGGNGDALAISDDQGDTFRTPLQLPVAMTAFLRRANGTILVASSDGKGFASRDGGASFVPWATPNLRALGERAGRLYAAADNVRDGWAVAVSDDEGANWQPLLRFDEMCGLIACVQQACEMPWRTVAATLSIRGKPACTPPPPPDLAMTTTPPPPPDLAMSMEPPPPPAVPDGCGCRTTSRAPAGPLAAILLAALVAARLRRRR